MKIVFFATLMAGDSPWGGSEELWCRTARLALERGHQVAVVYYRWPELPPKIRDLKERGAWLLGLGHFISWFHARSTALRLQWKVERDFVFGARWLRGSPKLFAPVRAGHSTWSLSRSSPGSLTVMEFHILLYVNIILRSPVFRLRVSGRLPSVIFRVHERVAFVAERNLRVAERQIAAGLPNGCVVRNPVNLANFDPVPWPSSDVVKLANVARLHAHARVKTSFWRR